jgi:hypothetical protein
MTVSTTKLQRPATFGEFSLEVDDVFCPSRIVAYRRTSQDRVEEVASTTLISGEALLQWLVGEVGFPPAASRALDVQLVQKLHAASLRRSTSD